MPTCVLSSKRNAKQTSPDPRRTPVRRGEDGLKSNLLLHNPDERRDCESHVPGFSFQRRLLSVNPLSLNLEELTTTRPATTTTIVAISCSLLPILHHYRIGEIAHAPGPGVIWTPIGSDHGNSHLYQTEGNRARHGRDPNPFSDCLLQVLSPPDFEIIDKVKPACLIINKGSPRSSSRNAEISFHFCLCILVESTGPNLFDLALVVYHDR